MDTTAIGIVAGLLTTGAYSLIRALRQRSFELGATILVFLGGFSVPGGAQLIRVALSGDPNYLPSFWREYVAVAGVVAIGLALHFLVQSFRNVWAKRATISSPGQAAETAFDAEGLTLEKPDCTELHDQQSQ